MFARLGRSTATAACSASATDLVSVASSNSAGHFHFGVQSRSVPAWSACSDFGSRMRTYSIAGELARHARRKSSRIGS
jgi:hypothetical protein